MKIFKIIFAFLFLLIVSILGGCGLMRVTPYDATVGWAVGGTVDGYGTILKTTDGGANWVRQGSPATVPGVSIAEVKAIDNKTAWVTGGNTNGYGTILKTIDGGANWSRQGSAATIPDVQLTDIKAISRDIAWVVGDQGVILHTTDGGQTWTRQGQGQVPADKPITYVAAADSQNVWIVGYDPNGIGESDTFIYRSSDGGFTWSRQAADNIYLQYCAPIDMGTIDPEHVWLVGTSEMVLYTGNGGTTWENISWHKTTVFGPHANGVCAFDSRHVWVAADYNVMHFTSDGGQNWRNFNLAGVSQGDFWLMRVTGYNPNVIWVTGANPRGMTPRGGILHTTDGGTNWVKQQIPVDTDLRGLSFVGAWR